MNLKKILKGLDYEIIKGDENLEINKIEYDSRKIEKNDIFVCIQGFNTDGHKYINKAIEKGARVIICEKDVDIDKNVVVIKTNDTRKGLAKCAANYYDHPEGKIKVIGITGTNGKTTSTFIIKAILENAGYKVGLIGTIANYIGSKKIKSHRTTPESLELFKFFNDMVEEKTDYCIMEVSSHSLSLNRVYGIEFNEGIFTNLTQDHLDFHKTFENYYAAKLKLFKNSLTSIVNLDDEYGNRVYNDTNNKKITYAIENNAELRATNINMHSRGIEFDLNYNGEVENVNINIPGKYNVLNSLASAAACLNEGVSLKKVKEGLESLIAVPGRCENVTQKYNLDYEVIVDYAHTPDGLSKILNTAREFTKGKLISVFGCGGDRDRTKRPIMGGIGSSISDIAIITSDNPRSENPSEIIKDVVKGIKSENYIVIENRREAIKKAMCLAKKGDVVVVAGKGHEDYQILKDKTIHFDEREVIDEIIKELY